MSQKTSWPSWTFLWHVYIPITLYIPIALDPIQIILHRFSTLSVIANYIFPMKVFFGINHFFCNPLETVFSHSRTDASGGHVLMCGEAGWRWRWVGQWLAWACACYVDLFSRHLNLSTLLLWHLFFFVHWLCRLPYSLLLVRARVCACTC